MNARWGPAVGACIAVVLALPPPAVAGTQSTVRVSERATGHDANQNSSWSSVSADGRFVAFSSYASNLVAHDTNETSDIFVRDLVTGSVRRVSVASDGTQADSASFHPSISADGDVIAFQSSATNLVAGDTEAHADVFVHVVSTGQTLRVSVGRHGGGANDDSVEPAISGNGRVVTFGSVATNLVSEPVNATGLCCDIFVRDLTTGRTSLAAPMLDGTGSSDSFAPVLSYSGRDVAFGSWGCSMVRHMPCEDESNVFERDMVTGRMRLVTRSFDGRVAYGCGANPAISADGTLIAFTSDGGNVVAGDTNSANDVFVRNLATGVTTRVSVTSKGAQTNGALGRVTMSGDGRFIVFQSDSWNIVAGDSNLVSDVFVHDMRTGKTTRSSVSSSGAQADGFSANAAISADGSLIAFESDATNLVANDSNRTTDIFGRLMVR